MCSRQFVFPTEQFEVWIPTQQWGVPFSISEGRLSFSSICDCFGTVCSLSPVHPRMIRLFPASPMQPCWINIHLTFIPRIEFSRYDYLLECGQIRLLWANLSCQSLNNGKREIILTIEETLPWRDERIKCGKTEHNIERRAAECRWLYYSSLAWRLKGFQSIYASIGTAILIWKPTSNEDWSQLFEKFEQCIA